MLVSESGGLDFVDAILNRRHLDSVNSYMHSLRVFVSRIMAQASAISYLPR